MRKIRTRVKYSNITENQKDMVCEMMKDMPISVLSKKTGIGVGWINKICAERFGKRDKIITEQLKQIKDVIQD